MGTFAPLVGALSLSLSLTLTHFDNCRAQGISFQPLVVETFGGWDLDAVKLLKDMARQSARRWGKNSAEEIKYFFQRLSVSLQRGNASLLIERDTDSASV